MSGIKGLRISNVDGYVMRAIYGSNAPLPVTRHQFRMMCNKDILQLSSEDLNQSVCPENQLPLYKLSKSAHLTHIQYVQAVCYQDMFCWDIFTLEGGTDWLS